MDDFMDLELDFNLEFGNDLDFNEVEKKEEPKEDVKNSKRSTSLERKTSNIYRRAFSETQLLDLVTEFKKGYSYNFITGGDVDGLSYLKLILRHHKLEYCLLSSWCIAMEDLYQIEDFLKLGLIKKMDFYVGEIFKGSYIKEYHKIKELIKIYGGKMVVFKNHSKILAGYGEDFYFGCQMSCNINTNPRTENACITIEKEIFDFYFDYFDGIKSFEK